MLAHSKHWLSLYITCFSQVGILPSFIVTNIPYKTTAFCTRNREAFVYEKWQRERYENVLFLLLQSVSNHFV